MDRHQRQSAIEEWLNNGEIILKEHEKLKSVEDPQQSAHVAFFELYYRIDKLTIEDIKNYSDLLNKKRANVSSASKLKGAMSTFIAQTLTLFACDISQKQENIDFMKREGSFPVDLSAKQAEENKRRQEERRKIEEQRRREEAEQKRREEEEKRRIDEEREREKDRKNFYDFFKSRHEEFRDFSIKELYRQREEYASKILTKRKKLLWIILSAILLIVLISFGFLWKKVSDVNHEYNTFISQNWTDLSGKECNRRLEQIDSLQEDFIFYLLMKNNMMKKRYFIVDRKELLNKTIIDNLEKCFKGKIGSRTIDKYARQKNVKEINKIYHNIEELRYVEKPSNRKKADEYQKELNQIAEKYGIKYDTIKKAYVVGTKKKNKTTTKSSSSTKKNTQSITKNNGHEFIDLGLSVKWATCNVGAKRPEEYGDYFAWGEVRPKSVYDNETYKYKANTLDAQYDVAIVNWGGSWRMPTNAEITELRVHCKWTWTTLNGVHGYKVSGKNGNSIFLPAAGYMYKHARYLVGSRGTYWSRSCSNTNTRLVYNIDFSLNRIDGDNSERYFGFSVRPVCE